MRAFPGCLLGVALVSCETRQPVATNAPAVPPGPATTAPAAMTTQAVARLDTADYMRSQLATGVAHPDTLIALGPRHYWLQLTQVTDSTKPIDFAPAQAVGKAFAAPTDTAWQAHRIRGYEGTYTFTLRDSARRTVVFQQQLHKRDFPEAATDEVLTVSEPEVRYLGYSAGLHSLVFVVYTGIPYSDVIDRRGLLLDARTGQVQRMYGIGSGSFEAIDCDPQPSPDGRAVLTCASELLRTGRPALSLRRPHAELRAARFLTDTTLLAVYEFGDYRPVPPDAAARYAQATEQPLPVASAPVTAEMTQVPTEFFSTLAQRRQVNAFVLGISGRVLAQFHYDGWEVGGMAYYLPRHYLAATRTYYLLNGARELLLLPKARPGTTHKVQLKSVPKFQSPQRSQEVSFSLSDGQHSFQLYVDTTASGRIRCQRQRASLE